MTQTTSENAEVRYKIGDVCRIADVQPYVLRYWESEFPLLAPDRSLPGPRTYSARELELIGQIKRLLYDEGYTIAGAKKRLESEAAAARSHDTKPAFIPLDGGTGEKGERAEKPPEKTVRPPERPRRPPVRSRRKRPRPSSQPGAERRRRRTPGSRASSQSSRKFWPSSRGPSPDGGSPEGPTARAVRCLHDADELWRQSLPFLILVSWDHKLLVPFPG